MPGVLRWEETTLRVKQWHSYLGGYQQLFNWTLGLLSRRKVIPDPGHLTNHPGLVMSWILEENLLLALH